MLRAASDARLERRSEHARIAAMQTAIRLDASPFRAKNAKPTDPEPIYRAFMGLDDDTPAPPSPAETKARLTARFDLEGRFPDLFPPGS